MKKLLCLLLMGCAPSYWMERRDYRTSIKCETVPATRDLGGDDPVILKAELLDGVRPVETRGSKVRVTPRHTRNQIGWAVFGIGAVLAAAGMGAGLSAMAPCTGDEACWVPQMVSGSTLGAIGGISMIIGGVVAGTSLHEAEVR
jgi:hypothetical protein